MSAATGLVTGVVALSALQAVVSSQQASGRVGSLLTGAGTVIEHLASPNVPAIPDLRTKANATVVTPLPNASAAPPVASPSTRLPVSA